MAANLIAKSSERLLSFNLGTRTRWILLMVLCAVCYLLGFSYHLIVWSTGEPFTTLPRVIYNLVVLTCYGSLWLLLSQIFRQRAAAPGKIFWTALLTGVLFLLLGFAINSIGSAPDLGLGDGGFDRGYEYGTGVPLTLYTVFKMNLATLMEAGFAFILLLRLRDLVLFKRSKSSQRNWYLMLGFMVLAALVAFMKPPWEDEYGPLQAVAIVPAVVFMAINSFRLSWIVYLSFKEKMAIAGLSLLLLILLVAGLATSDIGFLPNARTHMRYYSYPLSTFAILAVPFGILYCITAFLSLLFHLPTTGDFQRKVDEMAAMHSLTHLVSQVFDSEKLVSTIAASPVEAGLGDRAWLALADPQSGSLRPRVVAAHGLTPERVAELADVEALYEEVQEKNAPLMLEQAAADHRIEARPGEGLGSLLVVPLLARDELLGALFVVKEVSLGFEKDDLEALAIFAAQAALALDNARLFKEQLEKERLTRELAIAREVQHKLLPQKLPALDGVTLAASSVSAQEVGGDYYDFARLTEEQVAFIVADVSGKGTSAAFYMAELQGIFQSGSRLTPSPCAFLAHANEALRDSLEKNTFISVIYGILDLKDETLRLARAGHCPAAVINLTGAARLLRTQGLGLGLDHTGLFQRALVEESIRLQPGDVFVLYTDGVVESRNAAGEEYGYDRLLSALAAHRHEDAAELHTALLQDLHAFLGHTHYDDDLTLVVLKWHGLHVAKEERYGSDDREAVPVEEGQPSALDVRSP